MFFDITDRIGAVHPTIYQSPAGAVAALYSDETIMNSFYRDNKVLFTAAVQEAAKVFRSIVLEENRPLRVLEVGCGTWLSLFVAKHISHEPMQVLVVSQPP